MNNHVEKMKNTFSKKYEGGHPMRDPLFLERYKLARSLDPHYDKEGAKKTSLERYGEEFFSRTEEARSKSRKSMNMLHETGKSYSGKNRKDCPNKELLGEYYSNGKSLGEIALYFEVSAEVASRWVKEAGLGKRKSLGSNRKVTMGKEELLREYEEECVNRKEMISPYTFGKIKNDSALVCKLKRLLARDPTTKDRVSSRFML